MVLVLGVSAGASGARAVLALPDRPHHDPFARRAVRRHPDAPVGDPVLAAIRAPRAVALDRGERVVATAVTLRVDLETDVAQALDADRGGASVHVLEESSAQIRYLRFTGVLPRHGAAVLYDVGGSGLTMCLVDGASGEIAAYRRSDLAHGDRVDRVLQQHLASAGVWRDLGRCRDVKERLTHERVVTVTDPQTAATAVVTTGDLTHLVRGDLEASVSLLHRMVDESGTTPSLAVLLGGGAQLPGLPGQLESVLGLPVSTAPDPTSVAGRGAVLLTGRDRTAGAAVG